MNTKEKGCGKHAYLIIAHNNFGQLQTLVSLLDDPRNDIYIHIDRKAKGFSEEMIKVSRAGLCFTDRVRVNWGGANMVEAELILLKAAAKKHYSYYHLLSGIDLPLKTQDEIHAFFENNDRNYMGFDKKANEDKSFMSRILYYHFLQNIVGRNRGAGYRILGKIEKISLALQKKLKIKRKQYIPAYKGTQWFSIRHELAEHVLSQEKLIRKQFYCSSCADEVFLHSIAMASPYRDSIENDTLREIDWKRGRPYVFRAEDKDMLMASGKLFARKFDVNVDREIIETIAALLGGSCAAQE